MLNLRATRVKPPGNWVVVSLAAALLTAYTSFPRKRESILQPSADVVLTYWIPAFAGMTCGLDSPFHSNDTTTGNWRSPKAGLTGSGRRYISIAARPTGHC